MSIKTLSPAEAAARLHLSQQSLRRYHRDNKLRAIKTPGNHHRYLESDVQTILQCQREGAELPVYANNIAEQENLFLETPKERREQADLNARQKCVDAINSIGFDFSINDINPENYMVKIKNSQDFGFLFYDSNKDQIYYKHFPSVDSGYFKQFIDFNYVEGLNEWNEYPIDSQDDLSLCYEQVREDMKTSKWVNKLFSLLILIFIFGYSLMTILTVFLSIQNESQSIAEALAFGVLMLAIGAFLIGIFQIIFLPMFVDIFIHPKKQILKSADTRASIGFIDSPCFPPYFKFKSLDEFCRKQNFGATPWKGNPIGDGTALEKRRV